MASDPLLDAGFELADDQLENIRVAERPRPVAPVANSNDPYAEFELAPGQSDADIKYSQEIAAEAKKAYDETGAIGRSLPVRTLGRVASSVATGITLPTLTAAKYAGIPGAEDLLKSEYRQRDLERAAQEYADSQGSYAAAVTSQAAAGVGDAVFKAAMPGGLLAQTAITSGTENLTHSNNSAAAGAAKTAVDVASTAIGPLGKLGGRPSYSIVTKALGKTGLVGRLGASAAGEAATGAAQNATKYLIDVADGQREYNAEELQNELTATLPVDALMGAGGEAVHTIQKRADKAGRRIESMKKGERAAHSANENEVDLAQLRPGMTQAEFEAITGIKKTNQDFRDSFAETSALRRSADSVVVPPAETAVDPANVAPTTDITPVNPPVDQSTETVPPAAATDLGNGATARHRDIDIDREVMGLLPIPRGADHPDSTTFQAEIDRARQEGIPQRAMDVAAAIELRHNKEATPTEVAGLSIRMAELKAQYSEAVENAVKATDQATKESFVIQSERIKEESDVIHKAAQGSSAGRRLAFQKLIVDRSAELLPVLQRMEMAAGRQVTEAERAQAVDLTSRYKNVAGELEKIRKAEEGVTQKERESLLPQVLEDIGAFHTNKIVDPAKPKAPESAADRVAKDLRVMVAEAQARTPESRPSLTHAERVADLRRRIEKLESTQADPIDKMRAQAALDKIELYHAAKVKPTEGSALHRVLESIGNFHAITERAEGKERTTLDKVAQELDSLASGAKRRDPAPAGPKKKWLSEKERIIELQKTIDSLPSTVLNDRDRASVERTLQQLATYYDSSSRNAFLENAAKQKGSPLTAEEIAQFSQFYDELGLNGQRMADSKVTQQRRAQLEFLQRKLQKDIQEKINSLRPKSIWGHIQEPFHLARAVLASYDMSAILRQGGFVGIAHPFRAAKALHGVWDAFKSDFHADRLEQEIYKRPNAWMYDKGDLFLAREDKALTNREESYMSKWAERIPGFKASQRIYTAYLNRLRADSFDALAATLAKKGTPTVEELKAIGNFINVATGRGNAYGRDQAMTQLSSVFFAPRYTLSRFQLALGEPLFHGSARARKIVAQEYARYAVGMGLVYALSFAAWGDREDFEIGTDPESSDFGKIKIGDRTRIDPLSGLSQTMRMLWFTGKGTYATATGKEQPFGKDALTKATRFVRTKLAPGPQLVANLMSGKDAIGQKLDPLEQTVGTVFPPLVFRDIYKALKEDNVPDATATSLLSILGAGVQRYGPPKEINILKNEDGVSIMDEAGNPVAGPFKDSGPLKQWLIKNGYKRNDSGDFSRSKTKSEENGA